MISRVACPVVTHGYCCCPSVASVVGILIAGPVENFLTGRRGSPAQFFCNFLSVWLLWGAVGLVDLPLPHLPRCTWSVGWDDVPTMGLLSSVVVFAHSSWSASPWSLDIVSKGEFGRVRFTTFHQLVKNFHQWWIYFHHYLPLFTIFHQFSPKLVLLARHKSTTFHHFLPLVTRIHLFAKWWIHHLCIIYHFFPLFTSSSLLWQRPVMFL